MLLSYSSPKHYLVTGGCGFIGSHLADALINQGHRVTILDNLSSGKRQNAPSEATVIVGDTRDYETVEKAFHDIDGCFHLAAVASVENSVNEWAATHAVNITSTVNIFQASSRKAKKIPVVYTSSAAVYGNARTVPIAETAETIPLTAYGADKLSCDLHGRVAWHVHSIPSMGLRPFNVYGPRQDASSPYSGVISIFMDRIQKGDPVTIYGDGAQIRDFVYVGDAVRTFLTAMEYIETIPGHDIINICTGRATSINQLADTIAGISGCAVDRHYAPARTGDIRISVGNPTKLANLLGLKLEMTLQEGLRSMMYGEFEVQERRLQRVTAK